jgi:flagellar hook-length control protein FliK
MKMMIQQLSTQSADMSAAKSTGSSQRKDADQFRSMLQTAAQKTESQASAKDKSAGRIRNKTSQKDSADKMEQTASSSSPEAAFALPNETVPVALKESELLLQDSAQPENEIVQVLPVDALQMPISDIAESADGILSAEMEQANTAVSSEVGVQVTVSQPHAALPEGQILPEKQIDGNGLAAYRNDSKSNISRADTDLSVESLGESHQLDAGENTEIQQKQNVVSPQSDVQNAVLKAELHSSSANSSPEQTFSAKSSTEQILGPQIASAKKYTDDSGDVMPAESLSNLYGSGNVVIRVSDEMGKTLSSPIHQVANTAVYQMQNGKKEFTMELYPQSLGKVSVKMTSHSGLLTVEIAASNPKTQSLILSGSAEICNILQAATAQNVQTVIPNQQAAQWYGQPQDGGGNSGNRRDRQEDSRKRVPNSVESVSSEMNTEDFLTMMQQIAAYAR